jgi:hypothetical protein
MWLFIYHKNFEETWAMHSDKVLEVKVVALCLG